MQVTAEMLHKKYSLSIEGFYFKYRSDIYNSEIIRADLFSEKDPGRIATFRVTGFNESFTTFTHFQVINHFENFVSRYNTYK